MKWKEYRNETTGQIYLYSKTLLSIFGYQVRLHKIVRADPNEQYHSHPGWAFRIILWGGYIEELWHESLKPRQKQYFDWTIGKAGLVASSLTHRIAHVHGKASWSLWFRARPSAPTWLRGNGWPPFLRNRGVSND